MAGKVKHSEIIEDGLFQPTIEEAKELIKLLGDMKISFQGILETTKQQAKTNTFGSFGDVKQATQDLEAAKKAASELEKVNNALAVATQKLEAAQRGEVDAITKANVAKQIATAETKRLAKEQSDLTSEYDKQSLKLNRLRKEYKDLAIQGKENTEQARALKTEIDNLDGTLKKIDASVGQFQRNVGNYGSAFSGAFEALQTELRKVQAEIQELDAAGKPLGDLKRREEVLLETTKRLSKEYKTTTQQSKAFQESARQLGVEFGHSSEIFVNFKNQVGEGVDALADINDAVKLAASDTRGLDRIVGFANGIAGGFSAAEGAVALFGDESEDLQKTLVKLTAIQAVVNGLQAVQAELKNKDSIATKIQIGLQKAYTSVIGTSSGALKSFRTALLATGVGAFIVLLGAIIANWGKIKAAVSGVSEEQLKLNESAKKNFEIEQEKLETVSNQDNILRQQGKSEKEILRIKIQQIKTAIEAGEIALQNERDLIKSQIEAEKRNKAILVGILNFSASGINILLRGIDKVRQAFGFESTLADDLNNWIAEKFFNPTETEQKGKEEIKAIEDTLATLKNQKAGFELDIAEMDKQARQKSADSQKEEADKEKEHQDELAKIDAEAAKNRLKLKEDIQDLESESISEQIEREIQQAYLAKERRKAALDEQFKDDVEAQEDLLRAKQLIDKTFEAYEKNLREEHDKQVKAEAIQKLNNEIKHEEEMAVALLDQKRGDFEDEKKWEEYKAAELRKIRIKAIEAQLKAIEGQTSAEFNLLREQLKAELIALNAEIKQEGQKIEADSKKQAVATVKQLADEFDKIADKQAERREKTLDKETEASKKRQDELRQLAIQGDKNAQDSIAAEDKRQAEIERAREKELQRKKRRELALSAINTYNSKVQAGDKNALANTLKDLTVLSQAVQTLPIFYDGTEDTGPGGDVDGKGGFHAILHPNERVIAAKDNRKLLQMGLTNEEVVSRALMMENATKIPVFAAPDSTAVNELKGIRNDLQAVKESVESIPAYDAHIDIQRQVVIETMRSKNNNHRRGTRYGGAWDK